MKFYDYKKFDVQWQEKWQEEKLYETPRLPGKKKAYILDMFPYPSGEGLHVGHPKGYIATDIYSRFKRMNGFDVLHPMGWDAFGLPAEQFALKNKVHPRIAVEKNVATFKGQLSKLGLDYDWSREINTTDPGFYKWTQWIFTKLYEKGLAYESFEPINWCPSCKTGLANEDLDGNRCERCDSIVEKKPLRQWVLKITEYADRMIKDLDELKWPEGIKTAQKNWIGRSEGAEFDFTLVDGPVPSVKIFTTRADTLYGATFIAISAELAVSWITSGFEMSDEVKKYVMMTREDQKKDHDYSHIPEKTGIFTGIYAINPATGEKIPVWIANYVLGGVGTGAIMAVPSHDERDSEFAALYNLPRKEITLDASIEEMITKFGGTKVITYKIQDWVFARQRYWGEPFPVVRDETGKVYMVDESDLPVLLPEVESYEPTGTGESPLAAISDWVHVRGYITPTGTFKALPDFTGFIFDKDEPLDINTGPGLDAYQYAAPITERNNVACIIKHPTEDKYLVSKWKQVAWNGFLTGGVEEGSSPEETAVQEVREETGYTNIKKIEVRDFSSHGLFYHVIKKQNRLAHYKLVVVELEDLAHEPVSAEEQAICDFVWVDAKDVEETLTRYDMKSLWQYYVEGKVTGASPLHIINGTRETNTMPQWAGSSWYYLRFLDPHNDKAIVDPEIEKAWQPVDVYVGGDHATRHLIYARFWHKFLYDIGIVSSIEPFTRLEFLGFILAEDGRKMSKRWGNVINPDDVVAEYGADTLRVYEMFMAPFDQTAAWSTSSIKGADKFLDRVYNLQKKIGTESTVSSDLHKTIKKVTDDIESFKFNTAISQMMILVNSMEAGSFTKEEYERLLGILSPFAPHLTEQVWHELGNTGSIHVTCWPEYDVEKLVEQEVIISLQVDGKLRGTFIVPFGALDADVLLEAKKTEGYRKYVEDREPKKIIIIPNRLINIVI